MPPLPAVANVIKSVLHFTISEDTHAVCIAHWAFTGSTNATDMNALATGIRSSFHTRFSGDLTNKLSITGVDTIDLTSSTAAVGSDSTVQAFTHTGVPLPAETAILVSMQIQRRYRGGKPRMYIPGAPADALSGGLDANKWDAANVANWGTDFLNFTTDVKTTWGTIVITNLVNVSYFQGFTVVINPITGRARNVPTLRAVPVVDVIQSFDINPRPASQRRRSLQGV